jgi:hypothetical protein
VDHDRRNHEQRDNDACGYDECSSSYIHRMSLHVGVKQPNGP